LAVTLNDIARRLDISPATVSRALHDHPSIRRETKKRVRKLAIELGYTDYLISQESISYNQSVTGIIGVVLPNIHHSFISYILDGIDKIAYDEGYITIIVNSSEEYRREIANVRVLLSLCVAGVIVVVAQNSISGKHFREFFKKRIPMVFLNRANDDIDTFRVTVDDFNASFKMTEYLIEAGYRHIGYIAGPQFITMSKERLRGFKAAFREYGVPFFEKYVVYTNGLDERVGRSGCRELFVKNKNLDAIYTVNDLVALGAYQELRIRGYKIPDDIALIGFNDSSVLALLDPPLTTVSQPGFEMGVRAAEILIEQINNPDKNKVSYEQQLEAHLVIRESTKKSRV